MEALIAVVFFIAMAAVVVAVFVRALKKARRIKHEMWREVPPPNWRCRRGGVDYL